jgi:sterol desaturase/sphingolipid hydroxylase (fatty acid hydroxylase superfamily)
MDLILYAIPFFFLLIFVELGYGILRQRNTYRLNDTISSLSMGSLSRLQSLVILGISGAVYELIVQRYQLAQLPGDRAWVWISCFVLYDFAYYWKHRWGHEVALFWGSHVAHHQSENYNLSTALRQSSIDFYSFLFYVPFFLLGYPAEVLFTSVSLNLIYQFWVHTEHVPKLGIFEWFFVSPSNHRVHHGRNSIYVDKNYGGFFILWDRLFGSFQEELDSEPVVYGLRKPLNSWNPLWANIHVYWRLLKDIIKAPGLLNKLKQAFMPPGWQPAGLKTACQNKAAVNLAQIYNPPISTFISGYVLCQFIFATGLSLYTIIFAATLDPAQLWLGVGAQAFSLYVFGCWMESNKSIVMLEAMRVAALGACCVVLLGLSGVAITCLSFLAASFITITLHKTTRQQTSPV